MRSDDPEISPGFRTKNYCFTLNNWTDDEVERWKAVDVQYLHFGKEIGPENGIPHLQGFFVLKNVKTLSAAIKWINIPRTRLAQCRGTAEQNIVYTGKDQNVFRKGRPPMTKQEQGALGANHYDRNRVAMEEGREDDVDAEIRCMRPKLMDEHRARALKRIKLEPVDRIHDWFYGPTHCGKTETAIKISEETTGYEKTLDEKYWNGYLDQDVVYIDDVDHKHVGWLQRFKTMAHRHPFTATFKYEGARKIRPKRIVITSNYRIEELWPNPKENEPLLRRFRQLKFPNDEYPKE